MFGERLQMGDYAMKSMHSKIVIIGTSLVFVLVVVAALGDAQTRTLAFIGILVLLMAYAVWQRAWWMLIAAAVGAVIGLM